ncbi:hypothetical protein C8J57DRAFT_430903 [Mycena rebaudengoi]|nr:hypothetical protein C8J57DRAFT_430903 [Mycena rebaudengoi]
MAACGDTRGEVSQREGVGDWESFRPALAVPFCAATRHRRSSRTRLPRLSAAPWRARRLGRLGCYIPHDDYFPACPLATDAVVFGWWRPQAACPIRRLPASGGRGWIYFRGRVRARDETWAGVRRRSIPCASGWCFAGPGLTGARGFDWVQTRTFRATHSAVLPYCIQARQRVSPPPRPRVPATYAFLYAFLPSARRLLLPLFPRLPAHTHDDASSRIPKLLLGPTPDLFLTMMVSREVHILALESAVVLVITPESESFFMTPEPILSRCSSGWVQCPPPPSVPPADRAPLARDVRMRARLHTMPRPYRSATLPCARARPARTRTHSRPCKDAFEDASRSCASAFWTPAG